MDSFLGRFCNCARQRPRTPFFSLFYFLLPLLSRPWACGNGEVYSTTASGSLFGTDALSLWHRVIREKAQAVGEKVRSVSVFRYDSSGGGALFTDNPHLVIALLGLISW